MLSKRRKKITKFNIITPIKLNIISYFPECYRSYFKTSIVGKAIQNKIVKIKWINVLDECNKNSVTPDDYVYGGGSGLIMTPYAASVCFNKITKKDLSHSINIVPSPEGRNLSSELCEELLLKYKCFNFIAPRYEGIDARVIQKYSIMPISIGDYVITDGDLAIMVIVNVLFRRMYLPEEVLHNESYENGHDIEHDQFTKPKRWEGMDVPDVLTEGNHFKISLWRKENSAQKTLHKKHLIEKEKEQNVNDNIDENNTA